MWYKEGEITSIRSWNNLFEATKNQTNTIYMGDFNAHNIAWNCYNTNENGEKLWTTTYNKELICVNLDTMSRQGSIGQNSSNINLVFTSSVMANRLEVVQDTNTWVSDHYLIELNIDLNLTPYRKKSNRISTKNELGGIQK